MHLNFVLYLIPWFSQLFHIWGFSRNSQSSDFRLVSGWRGAVVADEERVQPSLLGCSRSCTEHHPCTTLSYQPSSGLCLLYNVSLTQSSLSQDASWSTAYRISFQKGIARLVDGGSGSYGRAELYIGDRWGSVVDREMSRARWPTALCKELGFTEAASTLNINQTQVPRGSGHVAMSAPLCKGYLLEGFDVADCNNPNPPPDYSALDEVVVGCADHCVIHPKFGVPCP